MRQRNAVVDDPALAETRTAFTTALERGDAAGACAVYADGARLVAPSAELIEGRDAIEAYWQAGVDTGIQRLELEALDVIRGAALACEVGRYALRLVPETGGTVFEAGTYVLVHEQQVDGSWRWVIEMFNPDGRSD